MSANTAPAFVPLSDPAPLAPGGVDCPPVSLGNANPWNGRRYTTDKRPLERANALFPDPAAPGGVSVRAVVINELWESVSAADVTECDSDGRPHLPTHARHIVPLSRLTSPETHARKLAAYSAKLATVKPGYCPECWNRGKAIPAPTVAACPFVSRHGPQIPTASRA